MDDGMVLSRERLSFTFEGGYEVDALTVSKTIDNLVNIMSITAQAEYPEVVFRLSISAVKPGSLDIDFNAITESLKNIFTEENVTCASNIVKLFISFFDIKKHLKSKKPRSVEQDGEVIKVVNNEGNSISVPKGTNIYFNNYKIDNYISGVFSAVSSSNNVDGVSLFTDSTGKLAFSKDDLTELSNPIPDLIEPSTQKIIMRTDTLYIKKPDLLGDSMWTFESDRQISAEIIDNDFISRIRSAEIKVCAGMSITVEMEVRYDLDKDNMPDPKSYKYKIVRVLETYIPGEGQISFL